MRNCVLERQNARIRLGRLSCSVLALVTTCFNDRMYSSLFNSIIGVCNRNSSFTATPVCALQLNVAQEMGITNMLL